MKSTLPTVLTMLSVLTATAAGSSCAGRCGSGLDSSQTCQCNDACLRYNDCCEDYSLCDPAATCVGRACTGDDSSLPCQCNDLCTTYNDCCPDREAVCSSGGTEDSCQGRCGKGTDSSKNCQCNSYCIQYNDCCYDYEEVCTATGGTGCSKMSVSNAELKDISLQLWNLDTNSAKPGQILVNMQGQTSSSDSNDVAPAPFFDYVDESLLESDMYKKLEALQDNYFRTQGTTEVVTEVEEGEDEQFIDAFLATAVGQQLFQFLDSKNLAGCDGMTSFKTILLDIWFGMYDRKATHDTSGFEHSFVGEIKGSSVSGFHNWVNFYRQEQAGNFNYQGWIRELSEPQTVAMRHTWYGATKPLNGFTIGTSPEIEMALYTLCHLSRPNSQCYISKRDDSGTTAIQTYTWTKEYPPSGESYVASAYFVS